MSGTSGRSGEKPARAGRSIRITPRSCFRKGLFHLVMIALEQKLCPVNRLQADPRPAGAAGLRGRFGKQALVDTLPPVATLKGGLLATHSRWFQSLKPDLSSGIIFFLKNHPAKLRNEARSDVIKFRLETLEVKLRMLGELFP